MQPPSSSQLSPRATTRQGKRHRCRRASRWSKRACARSLSVYEARFTVDSEEIVSGSHVRGNSLLLRRVMRCALILLSFSVAYKASPAAALLLAPPPKLILSLFLSLFIKNFLHVLQDARSRYVAFRFFRPSVQQDPLRHDERVRQYLQENIAWVRALLPLCTPTVCMPFLEKSCCSHLCLNVAANLLCSSQPDASIPNHTIPETSISYYKRESEYDQPVYYRLSCSHNFQVICGRV